MGLPDISGFASGITTNATNFVKDKAQSIANSKLGDAVSSRLSIAGLFPHAGPSPTAKNTKTTWIDNGVSKSDVQTDWRLKISTNADIFYKIKPDESNTLLRPLINTGGLIFPITPVVQISHTARYSSQPLTHSNYNMQFYEGSEVAPININGEFPIQTIEEGQYLLAAVYFLRSATKMFWGSEANAGTPPPIVFLEGYGDYYFPKVPCVVTNFQHSLPADVDYMEIPVTDSTGMTVIGSTRLPLQSQLMVTLQPIYSRTSLEKFTLGDFAQGRMISGGFM